jgi:hypothetical protein
VNIQRLKEAEAAFLGRYPLGFDDPGLAPIRKRHNVVQLANFARDNLTELTIDKPTAFCELLVKIVGRSSMVSRFEKAPFRECVASLTSKDRRRLADAYRRRLFGRKKRQGFDEIVEFFAPFRLARWSLTSAVPFYLAPTREVFVKPTTAKKIVAQLEAEGLEYHARPDWPFYDGYRRLIREVKQHLDPSLTSNNAVITGLLMSTL